MRGSFRSDLELVPGVPAFRLRRRRGARALSISFALAGLVFTAVGLAAHRPIATTPTRALARVHRAPRETVEDLDLKIYELPCWPKWRDEQGSVACLGREFVSYVLE